VDHPDYAASLNNLASLYRSMREYAKAEQLFNQAMEIRRKALGVDHPDYAISLDNLAGLYRSMGEFAQAEPLLKQAMEIRRKTLGVDHLDYARSLHDLGVVYSEMDDWAKAERLWNQAMEIRGKTLGENHPDYAASLNALAWVYRCHERIADRRFRNTSPCDMSKHAKAERLWKQAMEIQRNTLGEDHPDYAASLNGLAGLYSYHMREYAKAEPLFKQAMEIRRKALGENHPSYAWSLDDLAWLYERMGEYAKAEPLYEQAMEIRRKTLGVDHPDYGTSLYRVGTIYWLRGEYAKAEPLLKQELETWRKIVGVDHRRYAKSLHYVGQLYWAMGEWAKAERVLKQALEIRRKTLGVDHPSYAGSLDLLAYVYISMEEHAKAEALHKQAVEIKRKVVGVDDPGYAYSLHALGRLYGFMGEYAKAERVLKEVIEIRRKTLGEDHTDYAWSLNDLGILYRKMGEYAKAEALLKQAVEIRRKTLGADHPHCAWSLRYLGLLYDVMGEYAKAEAVYKQAIEIWRKGPGVDHPLYASSLKGLARVYFSVGEYAKAEPLLKQAIEIRRRNYGVDNPEYASSLGHLAVLDMHRGRIESGLQRMNAALEAYHRHTVSVLAGISEQRQLAFLEQMWSRIEESQNMVRQNPKVQTAISIGADWLAKWKGLAAEMQTQRHRLLRLAQEPELEGLLDDLSSAQRQLAQMTLSPPPKLKREHVQLRREEAREKVAELEEKLARRSSDFAELRRIGQADLAQIAQALPPDSALLDIGHFREYDFKAKEKEEGWGAERYLVFVTPAGVTAEPVMVDLGPAEPIDKAVAEFRKAIREVELGDTIADQGRVRQTLTQLSELLLAPILPHVKDKDHLVVCPDGRLALVPFECLLTKEGEYLIEFKQVSYLSAGREAVAYTGPPDEAEDLSTPLLFGDPDFDLAPEARRAELERLDPTAKVVAMRGVAGSRELRQVLFTPLPGTRAEVEMAAQLMGGTRLLGERALEGAAKRVCRPEVLYFATHGFFLPDQEWRQEDDSPLWASATDAADQPILRIENPMLRCGLALAGTNRRDAVPEGSELDDGLLTGLEVSGLDLWGTKLVVLSACETGLGDIKQGEGVMGLRRAFIVAGARRILATLWMVPDERTRELMGDFIKRWKSGTPAVTALREAQLATIASLRKEHGFAHPFLWAAFTITGDWR
jgi:tetratricopeptide (TPR) repeat protein